jgi:hypothetical protein
LILSFASSVVCLSGNVWERRVCRISYTRQGNTKRAVVTDSRHNTDVKKGVRGLQIMPRRRRPAQNQ